MLMKYHDSNVSNICLEYVLTKRPVIYSDSVDIMVAMFNLD